MKNFLRLLLAGTTALILACTPKNTVPKKSHTDGQPKSQNLVPKNSHLKQATFAGGCFWCMEKPFEDIEGVKTVLSGYAGGTIKNPDYKLVSSGATKHIEAVQIYYDPSKVSFKKLVDVFWRQIDPTDDGGQFVDRGYQYTSAIFYRTPEEKAIAEQSKDQLEKSGRYDKKLLTPIKAFTTFYPAEEYHQDYYKKNPIRYNFYRRGSGRDAYLSKIWKDHKSGNH
ncbi:MAG: peptide-methionine (S)-S-oxide reductase [Bdellovibrionaceae bacterium]|nr:peptide-methionine (S)-S-oxide reductase [Pseudobdellovibrionaceae bacterium]